jgi:hypothetical protein
MKFDLSHAMKISNAAPVWCRFITLHDVMQGIVQNKIDYMVSTMSVEPTTVTAIRDWMQVSDRVKPTLRNAFGYLRHTYQSAVDHGQREGDWTYVVRLFPVDRTVYIVIETGSVLEELNSIFTVHLPGAVDFSMPAPTQALQRKATKVWDYVMSKSETHFELEICTLDNFDRYAAHAVEASFSKQHE